MKKFIFIAFIALLSMIGCKPQSEELTLGGVNLEETLKFDTDSLMSDTVKYKNVVFYESQITFNGDVDSLAFDSLKVVEIENVFQYLEGENSPRVIKFIHTDSLVVEDVPGFWCEDCVIELPTCLTLSDAVLRLRESNLDKPKGMDKAVLRTPLFRVKYEKPFYIFGQLHTGFVHVNTLDGSVGSGVTSDIIKCCTDSLPAPSIKN